MTTYRIYARGKQTGRWGRVGNRMSFDTRAEAELVASRYRQEYPDAQIEVRAHVR
jgi:hypothetical protein